MAVSIDQQFIEYIVKSVVGHPDDVKIERRIDEKGVLLELLVNPEDLGRVIGKRGATAQSLRTLLRALGTKNDARYNLKIIDTGYPEGKGPRTDDGVQKTPVESEDNSTGQAEYGNSDDGQSQVDDQAAVSEPAVADDSTSAGEPADKPVAEPVATSVADEPAATAPVDDLDMGDDEELPETPSESHSDVVSRTRKELADLDDLDV